MNVLLDTNVLSEPMRREPDAAVMAQLKEGGHRLHTASVVIHELRFGVRRLLFLGSSCICPKHAAQPIREEALLTADCQLSHS